MKHATRLALNAIALAAAAALAAPTVLAQQAAPAAAEKQTYLTPKLNKNQIEGYLSYPDQVLVVDVRRPDEITRIGGFPTYLSVQLKDLEAGTVFIPRDRTLLVVSNHANRAFRAGDLLLSKGFKVGGAIGVQDYEAEGGKIVKIVPPAPTVAAAAPAAN